MKMYGLYRGRGIFTEIIDVELSKRVNGRVMRRRLTLSPERSSLDRLLTKMNFWVIQLEANDPVVHLYKRNIPMFIQNSLYIRSVFLRTSLRRT